MIDRLNKSLHLGKILGVDLYVHSSFALVLLIYGLLDWKSIPIVLLAFLFVTIHEFSHALTGNYFGAKTEKIYLHFFGGVALAGEKIGPFKSFITLIAGPASNLVMASFFSVMYSKFGWDILKTCFGINVVLFLFNMLPIYPLDGGQAAEKLMVCMRLSQKVISLIMRVIGVLCGLIMISLSISAGLWSMLVLLGIILIIMLMSHSHIGRR